MPAPVVTSVLEEEVALTGVSLKRRIMRLKKAGLCFGICLQQLGGSEWLSTSEG